MKKIIFLFFVLFTLSACAQKETDMPFSDVSLSITSPAFADGEAIPAKYTCTGDNTSPELNWSEPPAGTRSLALIVDDPDAPVGTWVHWVLYNLPPDSSGLPEGYMPESEVSAGKNSAGSSSYTGPCPPSGEHRYFFKIYALDTVLEATPNMDKAGLLKLMEGHILGEGQLIGVYQKP